MNTLLKLAILAFALLAFASPVYADDPTGMPPTGMPTTESPPTGLPPTPTDPTGMPPPPGMAPLPDQRGDVDPICQVSPCDGQATGPLVPCEFYGTVWTTADNGDVVQVTIDGIFVPTGFTIEDCDDEPTLPDTAMR